MFMFIISMCICVCVCLYAYMFVCIGFGCCLDYISQIFILDITGYSATQQRLPRWVQGQCPGAQGKKGRECECIQKTHCAKHKIKSFVTCWVC